MQTKFYYGHGVDIYPVISTKKSLQIFIPDHFPWEGGAEKAEIILDKTHSVIANVDSRVIMPTKGGKHIKEIELPFECKKNDKPRVILADVLKKEKIAYDHYNGKGCDGDDWTQRDYTGEVMYCKHGTLEHVVGPYWGEQYQFNFTDKEYRPVAGGKCIKTLRFSGCKSDIWNEMESLFRRFMEKQVFLEYNDLSQISPKIGKSGMCEVAVFIKEKKGFEWVDL